MGSAVHSKQLQSATTNADVCLGIAIAGVETLIAIGVVLVFFR
jgi:hypothetical protein